MVLRGSGFGWVWPREVRVGADVFRFREVIRALADEHRSFIVQSCVEIGPRAACGGTCRGGGGTLKSRA